MSMRIPPPPEHREQGNHFTRTRPVSGSTDEVPFRHLQRATQARKLTGTTSTHVGCGRSGAGEALTKSHPLRTGLISMRLPTWAVRPARLAGRSPGVRRTTPGHPFAARTPTEP